MELDKCDRRILKILQTNNLITNLELSERVYLSAPTCLRRVRRLRQAGVIVADVCLIDPELVGKTLTVFIEVTLDRQSETLQSAFEKDMEKTPEVTQCYMISGKTDFMLITQVSDMKSYHAFVRRVLTSDPNIRNFRSVFALNRSKFRTDIDVN